MASSKTPTSRPKGTPRIAEGQAGRASLQLVTIPDRDAWSRERAQKYIQEGTGTLFDPLVVAVFLAALEIP